MIAGEYGNVLDIYELPYNPDIPVVCMDEKSYQLLGEAKDSCG